VLVPSPLVVTSACLINRYRASLSSYRQQMASATLHSTGFAALGSRGGGGVGSGGGGGLGSGSGGGVAFPKIRPAGAARAGLAGKAPAGGSVLLASGHNPGATALPLGNPGAKVQLSDLGWEDRERVLRTLFAKINAVQARVKRMPDHPLRPDPED